MPLLPDGGNYKGTNQFIAGNGARVQTPGTMYASGIANQYQQQLQGQLANNYQQYLGNVGIADAVYGNTLTGAQQSADSDLARLGEQRYRDVDLARLGNQNLGTYQDDLYGINQGGIRRNQDALAEQFRADESNARAVQDYLAGKRNLTTAQYQSAVAYLQGRGANLQNLEGFAQREYDLASQGAKSSFDYGMGTATLNKVTGERNTLSDATARGATGSVGFGQDLEAIARAFGLSTTQLQEQYANQLGGAQLGLDRTRNDIGQQRNAINQDIAQAGYGYQGNIADLNEQSRGVQFGQENRYRDYLQQHGNLNDQYRQNEAQYNYQRGQNDITSQTIDSVAREYGIREGDVTNALNQAMSRAGLDYNNTINQLNQMLASGNAQAQTQAQNFLASLLAQA